MSDLTPFNSVLVANRGEIALRVMRSVRLSGLRAIAVYTDADAAAPHVAFADERINIGAGPVADSYLNIDKILAAAAESRAEAIHPGYGFLSESSEFAQACADAGLVFIGPSASAIAVMGNKAFAKQLMRDAGVRCVPGYQGRDQSDARFSQEAKTIGFPVMIKAAAGGGGRGMRLVSAEDDFLPALHLAQSEAKSTFGLDEIILERAMIRPRHVEVQVFADRKGHTVHLGERDCSVQRRHQKVVEEAPCTVMTSRLRGEMGKAAVEAALAIGYEGAGTVEFLLDESGEFYFLEMNTRLQVEHPVTEMVTGKDLVALQLNVAQGHALGFEQSQVALNGHAIEVRLYAEDPANDFLPVSGRIAAWKPVQTAQVRVDDGVKSGQAVSSFYDSMLAKVIAYGKTRQEARIALLSALKDTVLFGITTNRDFLIDLLSKETFIKGAVTTTFIDDEYGPAFSDMATLVAEDYVVAAVLLFEALQNQHANLAISVPDELLGWGSPGQLKTHLRLRGVDDPRDVTLSQTPYTGMTALFEGQTFKVDHHDGSLRLNGNRIDIRGQLYDDYKIHVALGQKQFALVHHKASDVEASQALKGHLNAPMHGNIQEVFVNQGQRIKKGEPVLILEAMKMHHELCAQVSGKVVTVYVKTGDQVKADAILVDIAHKEIGNA